MYHQMGRRYPVGAYFLDKHLHTDEGVAQLAAMDVDFVVGAQADLALLERCGRHDLGVIASNHFPGWWGGDGKNAGHYAAEHPVDEMNGIASRYPRHAALWGDYLADEPSALDFEAINGIITRYEALLPGRLPFINLYPNYGYTPLSTDGEVIRQLGTSTYEEHIGRYMERINLPYLCLDYYPYTGPFAGYLDNLRIASQACVRAKRALWMIIQAGARKPEGRPDAFQILWQANVSLAYGARCIMHACYCKGWWEPSTSCVNELGEKNPAYGYVQAANRMLHEAGGALMGYEFVGTAVLGDVRQAHEAIREQLFRQMEKSTLPLPDGIEVMADGALLAGIYRNDEGIALYLVNTTDPFDGSRAVRIAADGARQHTLASGEGTIVYRRRDLS